MQGPSHDPCTFTQPGTPVNFAANHSAFRNGRQQSVRPRRQNRRCCCQGMPTGGNGQLPPQTMGQRNRAAHKTTINRQLSGTFHSSHQPVIANILLPSRSFSLENSITGIAAFIFRVNTPNMEWKLSFPQTLSIGMVMKKVTFPVHKFFHHAVVSQKSACSTRWP